MRQPEGRATVLFGSISDELMRLCQRSWRTRLKTPVPKRSIDKPSIVNYYKALSYLVRMFNSGWGIVRYPRDGGIFLMRPLKYMALAALALLCAATSASAIPIFTVTVNTSSIAGTVGHLDFNFASSFNSPDTTALVSMWTSDGTLSGSPSTFGTTSGVLPANVTMKIIGGAPADYFHDFIYGNSLTFMLMLTYDSAIPGSFTSDNSFGLALYDDSMPFVMPLLTDGSTDFIFSVDMHPDGSYTVHDASSNGQLMVTAAPEPSTWTLFGFGLLAVAFPLYRRRIRSARPGSETK